jgi:hypothetical protein
MNVIPIHEFYWWNVEFVLAKSRNDIGVFYSNHRRANEEAGTGIEFVEYRSSPPIIEKPVIGTEAHVRFVDLAAENLGPGISVGYESVLF